MKAKILMVLFGFIIVLLNIACIICDCQSKIQQQCADLNSYTANDLEIVRQYLIQRFANTNPKGCPCAQLRVRQNVRCLSPQQLNKTIEAFKTLLNNRALDGLTAIHNTYWPNLHKFAEALTWHRLLTVLADKQFELLGTGVTLPYWQFYNDFAGGENSFIFDIFGHAGTPASNYCVTDGPFANFTLNYPTPHCLKRQWLPNGKMLVWEPPEWATSVLQQGMLLNSGVGLVSLNLILTYASLTDYLEITNQLAILSARMLTDPSTKPYTFYEGLTAFTAHFKTHNSIGGINGDLTQNFATNDPLFYLFHTYHDSLLLKWQLSDDSRLVPTDYLIGLRYDGVLNRIVTSSLNDPITYYTNRKARDTFQVGYGDYCFIYDYMIKPIVNIQQGIATPLPITVNRLRSALPTADFATYFPKFFANTSTFFDHALPDIENCYQNITCSEIPIALKFTDTDVGLVSWNKFKTPLGLDLTPSVGVFENTYGNFMNSLVNSNYCSPYV